ncbi:MAG: amidohydrolase family protein [Sedimentibacter sp.]
MQKKFLKAGILIDGTGKDPLKNKGIVIEEGKIVKIQGIEDVPEDCVVYDYSNQTVMPGMINSHIHLDMEPIADPVKRYKELNDVEKMIGCLNRLEDYLNSGVTYVRSLGGENYFDVKFRDAIKKGMIKGPGISCAGPNLCMTGGHGWFMGLECDGPEECRKASRTVIKNGADCVKFMATGGVMTPNVEPGSQQFSFEEMKAIVDEAHNAGKRTATHAQGEHGILDAVKAGVDSVEHGIFLTDEIIEMMIAKGTFLVPTLAAPYYIFTNGIEAGIPSYAVKKAEAVAQSHIESFKNAYKAGVKIALGTDSGTPLNPHDGTWFELKLMVDCGVSPSDAIVYATKNAAELLSIDNLYGTIEIGKMADIIVVDDNPLDNIQTLSDIKATFKHGELHCKSK